MLISEYKKFISDELDRALAAVGDVPVVTWHHYLGLSERTPTLVTTRVDRYTGRDDKASGAHRNMVFIIGE